MLRKNETPEDKSDPFIIYQFVFFSQHNWICLQHPHFLKMIFNNIITCKYLINIFDQRHNVSALIYNNVINKKM